MNEAHIAYNRDNYGYTPPMYGQYVSKDLGIVNANINQETTGGALIGGWKGNLEYTCLLYTSDVYKRQLGERLNKAGIFGVVAQGFAQLVDGNAQGVVEVDGGVGAP